MNRIAGACAGRPATGIAAGYRSGFVDAESTTGSATDINHKPASTWRP